MNNKEFEAQYLNKFTLPEGYDDVSYAWAKYYYLTESYDRKVCTGWAEKPQIAVPETSHQKALIDQNASKVRREIITPLYAIYSKELIESVKREVSRLYLHQLKECLNR